jgi:hypothetical protein
VIYLEDIMGKTMLALAIPTLAFATLAIAAQSFSASAAEDEIYGTYTLISSTRKLLDTGQVETFNREHGFITYGMTCSP